MGERIFGQSFGRICEPENEKSPKCSVSADFNSIFRRQIEQLIQCNFSGHKIVPEALETPRIFAIFRDCSLVWLRTRQQLGNLEHVKRLSVQHQFREIKALKDRLSSLCQCMRKAI